MDVYIIMILNLIICDDEEKYNHASYLREPMELEIWYSCDLNNTSELII